MVSGEGVVDLVEAVEYFLLHLIRNADSGIGNIKLECRTLSGITEVDGSCSGKFQGVLEEVRQDLYQLSIIGLNDAFGVRKSRGTV